MCSHCCHLRVRVRRSFQYGVYSEYICFKIGFRNRRNDDGSIDVDSLDVTQSEIKINYRLSNDDVDDMHMEGVGYKEEWQ